MCATYNLYTSLEKYLSLVSADFIRLKPVQKGKEISSKN